MQTYAQNIFGGVNNSKICNWREKMHFDVNDQFWVFQSAINTK